MTSPEPADDGQIPPPENTPPTNPSPEPSPASEDTSASVPSPASESTSPTESVAASDSTEPTVDEGLPEWEPLTPELVEDEAIRGDFVIRWAVVGLALLFGFSQIDDTRTLVHIQTGQYLTSHGIVPSGVDVFSSTVGGHRWVNLSWMFDLCVAGIHAIGGGIGLSIFQGTLAGLAFGLLVHTYRVGIRTWWGSVCAVLALLACYPQLTVQPELITIAGMAALLWIIIEAEETPGSKILWLSVPLIWVWSQFDPRAFLGWLLLISMAVGQALRSGDDAVVRRGLWFRVGLIGLAIAVIHPFLWETWLSPYRLFGVEYPGLRQIFTKPIANEISFYPITSNLFWKRINHDSIAAFVLLGATVVSMVLNRERLNPGHVISVLLFNSLSFLATHELAAASLVNCVFATVNAQTWYRQRFGQIYSTDWRELLFSRGGRAVTVLCLFALAWTSISGRINGPEGKRTGIGFSDQLLTQIDSYKQIAGHSVDDHPFHFSARQGDLLIWVGQKSFIDTRASLFVGSGDNDILGLHNRIRTAIRFSRKPSAAGDSGATAKTEEKPDANAAAIWQEAFAKYKITHVMPRLSGPVPPPDYATFFALMSSGSDWVLTDLRAATAAFYRNASDGDLGEYLSKNRLDVSKLAFDPSLTLSPQSMPETLREYARPATTYDNLFSLREPRYPAPIQEASHYYQIGRISAATIEDGVACAIMAIRRAMAGLREDPNSAEGYVTLGLAQLMMETIETKVMQDAGIKWFSGVRYFQAVTALQQAAQLKPNDLSIQTELLALYERTQRRELALDSLRHLRSLRPPLDTVELRKQWEPLINEEFSLVEKVGQIEETINQQLQKGADRYEVAVWASNVGAVRSAIRILEEDAVYKEEKPAAKNSLGAWLLEAGRIKDGLETLEAVEQSSSMGGVKGWRDNVASGLLVIGDYSRAIRLWSDQIEEETVSSTGNVLISLPLQSMNQASDQYPLVHSSYVGDVLLRARGEISSLMFKIAMAQLEMGDNVAAKGTLTKMLQNDPNTPMLPLIKFYLKNLNGGKLDVEPKSEAPTIEEFELLEDASREKKDSASPNTNSPQVDNSPKVEKPQDEKPKGEKSPDEKPQEAKPDGDQPKEGT